MALSKTKYARELSMGVICYEAVAHNVPSPCGKEINDKYGNWLAYEIENIGSMVDSI